MPAATRLVLLLAAAVAAGVLLPACGGDDGKEAFQQEVVAARDRTDSALAQITQPKSIEDLIVRIRTAQDEVATASGEVGAAEAPEPLVDEQRALAIALSGLATELDGTADAFEQLGPAAADIRTLDFKNWHRVQQALGDLREQGIEVEPLGRHGGQATTEGS